MGLHQIKDLQSKHMPSTQGIVEAGGDSKEVVVLEEEDLGRTTKTRILKILVVVEEDKIREARGAFVVEVDQSSSKDKTTQKVVGTVVSHDTTLKIVGATPTTTIEEVEDSKVTMQTAIQMNACLS